MLTSNAVKKIKGICTACCCVVTSSICVLSAVFYLVFNIIKPGNTPVDVLYLNESYDDSSFYSDVCWLTSHNSFAHPTPSKSVIDEALSLNILPNQILTIEQQLAFGVRSFMIDLHYDNSGDVIIAHEGVFYKQSLQDFLKEIKAWLDKNKKDIITIHLESYVTNYDKIFNIISSKDIGLDVYLFDLCKYNDGKAEKRNRDCNWAGRREPTSLKWPTLGEMRGPRKYDLRLIAIGKNDDIKHVIKEKLNKLPEEKLPVLIKEGEEIHIYGIRNDGERAYTKLDANKIELKFPEINEPMIILNKNTVPNGAYDEITLKKGHTPKGLGRLVIFSDKSEDAGYGIMHVSRTMETQYNLARYKKCELRPEGRSSIAPLLIMNHFYPLTIKTGHYGVNIDDKPPFLVEIPSKTNGYDQIRSRVCDCYKNHNKWPNFIAVDFVGTGGQEEVKIVSDINAHKIDCVHDEHKSNEAGEKKEL